MKMNRRRRPLRPRPTRAQIAAELRRLRSLLNLFRLEWILETRNQQPRPERLRFLHDRIVDINDEIALVEQQ
jgi:hypothetical protein